MGFCKITKIYVVAAIGLTGLVVHQFSTTSKDYVRLPRILSPTDKTIAGSMIESYSTPGSIAAVINSAKMGTGGLQRTFSDSWTCKDTTTINKTIAGNINQLLPSDCKHGRRIIRTHSSELGLDYLLEYRKEHPEGQCLIATAIRNPAAWFGSQYLELQDGHWDTSEVMLQNYREWLATNKFDMRYSVLPGLLHEFNAGTLTQQAKIMDDNGGYSLTPAPSTSALPGCDLMFLRMEQSDRWPEFFEMLDPEFRSFVGQSRVDQNKANVEQINAIASYELTSEEKMNIYNTGDNFIQDWFDSYGYMDDVILIKPNAIKSYTSEKALLPFQSLETSVAPK